eukprot:28191_1
MTPLAFSRGPVSIMTMDSTRSILQFSARHVIDPPLFKCSAASLRMTRSWRNSFGCVMKHVVVVLPASQSRSLIV